MCTEFSVIQIILLTMSFWINMYDIMYCSVMLKNLHQSFKVNLNFILLLFHTTRIFAPIWSSVFSYYFYSVCKISLCCFSNIIHVFWEWLSTIFRKYWYSLNNKNNESHMSIKTRMRMLIFLLLMMWFHLLMNLIRTQILYMILLFSTMRIDFSRVVIL